jgi:hypothetical protein
LPKGDVLGLILFLSKILGLNAEWKLAEMLAWADSATERFLQHYP